MTSTRRRPPARALAAFIGLTILGLTACGGEPVVSAPPSGDFATAAPLTTPMTQEQPFAPASWPVSGSACDLPGYEGLLGRIEAPSVRTVRFTLCAPDGAFPARLAHPALGIVDTSSVALVEADLAAARLVPGAGAFRVDAWTPGENLQLVRVEPSVAGADQSPAPSPAAPDATFAGGPPATIVLRWVASAAARTAALRAGEVDGIDAPGAADLAAIGTLPELAVLPRPELATAYLGFGNGHGLGRVAVRRGFAQGFDTGALALDAFPAGSVAAGDAAPCEVTGGCAGKAWYEFNGPAGAAALTAAGFDATEPLPLHIPDVPVPGLPDPAVVAAAIRDQLATNLGVKITIDPLAPADLTAAIAAGSLDGLYLDAITSPLADAAGFLEPLFGRGAPGVVVGRARGVRSALAAARPITDGPARAAAFGAANDALRSAVPLVPLVHAGSTAVYQLDVVGAAVSSIGTDPLGAFIPGDRRQLVVMDEAEPATAWCAISATLGERRLCALVTPGLMSFAGASLRPEPGLASSCSPSAGARVWTCRLGPNLTFSDGKHVDAGDVLASLQAQADARSPLRAVLPAAAFATWDELFGGPIDAGGP